MLHLTTRAEKHLRESSSFIWKLLVFSFLIGFGTIYYVHLKNRQVIIESEIADLRCEIRICEMRTGQMQMKVDSQSNRWVLLDLLSQHHSQLSKINEGQIETIQAQKKEGLAQTNYR